MFEGLSFSSSSLAPGFDAAGLAMSAMGQEAASDAMVEAGRRKKMALDSQADQLEVNAGQQVAAAQRVAEDDRFQARLAMSRALAVAAASGGGASDSTVVNIVSRLMGQATYRSMLDVYQGQERARGMFDQANMARYSGDVALRDATSAASARKLSTVATLISGAATMYSRYGKKSDPNSPENRDNGWGFAYDYQP